MAKMYQRRRPDGTVAVESQAERLNRLDYGYQLRRERPRREFNMPRPQGPRPIVIIDRPDIRTRGNRKVAPPVDIRPPNPNDDGPGWAVRDRDAYRNSEYGRAKAFLEKQRLPPKPLRYLDPLIRSSPTSLLGELAVIRGGAPKVTIAAGDNQWQMMDGPYPPTIGWLGYLNVDPNIEHHANWRITSQALGATNVAVPATNTSTIPIPHPVGGYQGIDRLIVYYPREFAPGTLRGDEHSSWRKNSGTSYSNVFVTTRPGTSTVPINAIPGMDPNIMRRNPALTLQPVEQHVYSPLGATGLSPAALAVSSASPITGRAVSVGATTSTGGVTRTPIKVPTTGREPPGPGVRERKTMAKSRAVGIAIAGLLDNISESAEVIDAIFEALPEAVQKRWDCKRDQAFIDKAGQYGIDNADCKLRALWHNSHLIDVPLAIENIGKNFLKDQYYGMIHKRLPKNTGGALDREMKGLDKLYDQYIDPQWEGLADLLRELGL